MTLRFAPAIVFIALIYIMLACWIPGMGFISSKTSKSAKGGAIFGGLVAMLGAMFMGVWAFADDQGSR